MLDEQDDESNDETAHAAEWHGFSDQGEDEMAPRPELASQDEKVRVGSTEGDISYTNHLFLWLMLRWERYCESLYPSAPEESSSGG